MNGFRFPDCTSCKNRDESLFVQCEHEELVSISKSKGCHVYKKGEKLFEEGSKAAGLFCVYQGRIKLTKLGSNGKEQIISLVKPGNNIGYQALIKDTVYSMSAEAMEESTVCFVPANEFFTLVDENVRVSSDLMQLVCKALGESEEQLANMAMKQVRERIADALLLLKKTYEDGENADFSIPISREDLAGMVGTAKETAIRCLSELKDEGIIDTKGSKITLLDPDKLFEISHLYD